jgi:FtsH-binding integral membrane protein
MFIGINQQESRKYIKNNVLKVYQTFAVALLAAMTGAWLLAAVGGEDS